MIVITSVKKTLMLKKSSFVSNLVKHSKTTTVCIMRRVSFMSKVNQKCLTFSLNTMMQLFEQKKSLSVAMSILYLVRQNYLVFLPKTVKAVNTCSVVYVLRV